MSEPDHRCPHCQIQMARWANPEQVTWGGEFQFVCFNDECPYYLRGWSWMREHYNVFASYRHRVDPTNGEQGPLPVWSRDALKGGILPDEGCNHG